METEDKIPSVTGLAAAAAALNAVEEKEPNAINLVQKGKTDYDSKIQSKYFTTFDCNKLRNAIINNIYWFRQEDSNTSSKNRAR